MAKKSNSKVSVNQIEKLIKPIQPFVVNYEVDNEIIEIEVKPRLSFEDTISFVHSVAESVVQSDAEIVTYSTQDFSIAINTLEFYTNIRIPTNIQAQCDLVYGTDIIKKITSHVSFDKLIYEKLLHSVDKQITYEKETMQNQFKVKTQAYIDQIKSETEEIIETFKGFAEIFNKVDPQQIAQIIPKIANIEKLDEKQLVQAFKEVENEVK
jgi:hypothetical protein